MSSVDLPVGGPEFCDDCGHRVRTKVRQGTGKCLACALEDQ